MCKRERTTNWRMWVVAIIGPAALTALCSCHTTVTHPLDRQYTKQEWMEMLSQRQYQIATYWEGLSVGSLSESGASMSGPNLRYVGAQIPLLEHQLDKLREQDPLMFLPLFDSRDPGAVMTAIFVYRQYFPPNLTEGGEAKITAAFRRLLDHPDTRMRWAAIQTLGEHRWLTVDDVERGLNDETVDVRYTTAFWSTTLIENKPVYRPQGKLLEGAPHSVRELVETKRRLAPILLEHLNDTHFRVRAKMGSRFRNMFKKRIKTENGTKDETPATLPARFDWMRADWHSRNETQQQWQAWWFEHGEEALQWAHPAQ
ncbi:MAG: HEAT repeat domain-containing protein [Planctomycetota bacterium]